MAFESPSICLSLTICSDFYIILKRVDMKHLRKFMLVPGALRVLTPFQFNNIFNLNSFYSSCKFQELITTILILYNFTNSTNAL